MKENRWAREYSFSADNLIKLFLGEISYICIPNFSSIEECLSLTQAIKSANFDFYDNFDPPVGKLGITQYDGIVYGKDFYFEKVAESVRLQNKIFVNSFNPLERLINFLQKVTHYEVSVPYEPHYGKYFAGIIRELSQSVRTHADYAVYDAPEWCISEIESQITWNLYCELPKFGGECIIYNSLWDIQNDKIKNLKTYQYDLSTLVHCEAKVIKPQIGNLYLFNSRNFHEVTIGSSSRISVSSFIGKHRNQNQLFFWS